MNARLRWISGVLLIWAACSGQANAHLVNSGCGPFYDGVAHLLVSPEDLLVVLALALLAGQGGKQYGRTLLFCLPLAWLAGAMAGRMLTFSAGISIVRAGVLVVSGALVALAWVSKLQRRFLAGIALVVGSLFGLFNGASLADAASSGLTAAGIGCTVLVISALVAGQVAVVQKDWARIMVRVAGSWIGAIGLLMLGWAMRK
jgi:hypothetical protein